MGKLHEILSVESSLEKISKQAVNTTIKAFSFDSMFKGHTRRLEMFDESEQRFNKTTNQHLETTVPELLHNVIPSVTNYWGSVLAKDATNRLAKADITLKDGAVLAKDVPATYLLGLETKLGELRKLFDAMPTLPIGIKWIKDELEASGIYVNVDNDIEFKSETKQEYVEASPATKEHPAQVAAVKNVRNVGQYTISHQSGAISRSDKSAMLARFDEVFIAVKKARLKANNEEIVKTQNIGQSLLAYIVK